MKKILLAIVVTMAGRAYAADLSDLGVKASDLKAIAASDTTTVTPSDVKGSHDGPGGWHDGPGGHGGPGWPVDPEYDKAHRAFQELVEWAPKMNSWQVLEARGRVLNQLNYLNNTREDVIRGVVYWIQGEGRLEQVRGTLQFLIDKNGFPFIQNGARNLLKRVDGGWVPYHP